MYGCTYAAYLLVIANCLYLIRSELFASNKMLIPVQQIFENNVKVRGTCNQQWKYAEQPG